MFNMSDHQENGITLHANQRVLDAGMNMETLELCYIVDGNVQWCGYVQKAINWCFLKRLLLTYDPEVFVLGIYEKQIKYMLI